MRSTTPSERRPINLLLVEQNKLIIETGNRIERLHLCAKATTPRREHWWID